MNFIIFCLIFYFILGLIFMFSITQGDEIEIFHFIIGSIIWIFILIIMILN